MAKQIKIGLVLSGGGVKGVAHVGLLKALEDNDIYPTHISGSSAGAIVGALYACGHKPEEIYDFFLNYSNIFKLKYFTRSKPGILDSEKFTTIFYPIIKNQTFETLSKKLHICVTDVLTGRINFFSTGELIHPLLASAAVPGVFSPIEINDKWYIDGGTMNNFPVEPLLGRCDVLLGSFVSPNNAIEKEDIKTTMKLINRAKDLNFFSSSAAKFNLCDYVFIPDKLGIYGTFESKKTEEIYQISYEYAVKNMETILDTIKIGKSEHVDPLPKEIPIVS